MNPLNVLKLVYLGKGIFMLLRTEFIKYAKGGVLVLSEPIKVPLSSSRRNAGMVRISKYKCTVLNQRKINPANNLQSKNYIVD